EPPRGGNPLLNARLPNLIVTPHTAWASREALDRLFEILLANIHAFVKGEAQNRVV
ncbi:D-2-hydroxyacid dehydrogenase, partial [Neisseria gonorrhoeae]